MLLSLVYAESNLSAQPISRKLLKWRLLSTDRTSFSILFVSCTQALVPSNFEASPISASFGLFRLTAPQPQILMLEDLQVTGMVVVCQPHIIRHKLSNNASYQQFLPPTHFYPAPRVTFISKKPTWHNLKSFCFQAKVFEDILVLGDWSCSVEAHQKGQGSFPRTCVHAGSSHLTELIGLEVISQGSACQKQPIDRAEEEGPKIWDLGGVTTGRKTTLWASPFPNTLDKLCTLREQVWASMLTSLPFYTWESKTEIDRIPKEGRKVMKLSNVGQD